MESFGKIGIDLGSILLYLVNFGIIFALLGWLVFPKLLKLVDERRDKIASDLTTSEKLKEELEAKIREHQIAQDSLKAEFEDRSHQLMTELKDKREALLVEMDAQRAKMLGETNSLIATKKRQVMTEVKGEMARVMTDVVTRFLGSKVSSQQIMDSLEEATEGLEKARS